MTERNQMTESIPADVEFEDELPARRRIKFLTPWTAALMALILGGVGFYVGVRVEKSKTTSSGGSSAFARALSGLGTAGTSRTSGRTGTGASSFASRFGGGAFPGGGGAGATIGSISSIDGNTIYVTSTSGNTVKVKLSAGTTITKSESVSKKKLFPGDEIVVQGSTGSKGTVTATSVTDSGARSSGTGSGTSSASTGSTSGGTASSAISSLFGGG
jgi:hypothetical protein